MRRGGGRVEKPTAFFSKKLSETQKRYTATEKEALAIVLALEHCVLPDGKKISTANGSPSFDKIKDNERSRIQARTRTFECRCSIKASGC